MGDLKTLAKARLELEELYLGIPDDSVNLTFEDLAIHVKQHTSSATSEKITTTTTTTNLEPIQEVKTPKQAAPLAKLPSLDFNKGLQASKNHHQSHHLEHVAEGHPFDQSHKHYLHDGTHRPYGSADQYHDQSHHGHENIGTKSPSKSRFAMERSREYDGDVSVMNMNSLYQERSGRPRRPGIPHSNICTVCSTCIYIFRHRCLVCGRVYCRNCVSVGMGEMTEGRKCIECLGRRFSQRYIKRAGIVGCCSWYPSAVKQAELKWAEKGPRKAGERAFGHSTMTSRSRSPLTPRTPRTPAGVSMSQDLPSFVASSPYSPYSTHKHHHLPL
ncbi:hypothetical protein SADUNF_Sadunf13G0122700 [Salix dunnii]|uniref:Uncharacterized protein n=1 Tax=Salix dunnii TaxID=1413687 RepID=A0A835JLW2_9ROSI|nr:hypothetical protein SADUNF_Sadunf13G0122700 [Salix dunnii]